MPRCEFGGVGGFPSSLSMLRRCQPNFRRSLPGCRRLYCRPADYARGVWRVQPWLW